MRQDYYKGRVNLEHRSGNIPTADKLTKLGNVEEHRKFATILLEYDYDNRVSTVIAKYKADSVYINQCI